MEKVWGGRLKEDADGEGKRLVLGRGFVKNLVLEKREKGKCSMYVDGMRVVSKKQIKF